jgi:endonuclease YncB( thermonuclease family)
MMRARLTMLIMVLLMISPFVHDTIGYAEEADKDVLIEAKVKSVIDLETIEVDNGTLVKLYGVNMDYYREYIKSFKPDYLSTTETGITVGLTSAYFKGESLEQLVVRARVFYEQLLVGKTVYMQEIGTTHTYIVYLDHYKENSLNEWAVKAGYVVVSNDHQGLPELLIQQEEARISKAGLWNITVYSTNKGSWGDSNFVYFALGSLLFNIFLCAAVYGHYVRNRSFLGMCAVYVTFLTTTFLISSIYVGNDKQQFFWVPPIIVVLFALIGVLEFVLFIRSKNSRNPLSVAVEIVLFVSLVIVGFSALYHGYSNNVRKDTEISYSPPNYEYYSYVRTEEPHGNYIAVPGNEYSTHGLANVRNTNMVYHNYNLSYLNAIYFSAATFFTVGYGDLSPKGLLKTISIVQMFIGYISQVVLFSLVVSKVAASGDKNGRAEGSIGNAQPTDLPSRKITHKRLFDKHVRSAFFLIIILENLFLWLR